MKGEIGGNDILGIEKHALETSTGIHNHHFTLLNLIVEIYYDLFQHNWSKLKNIALHKVSCRQRSNKTVLFKGQ